MSPAVTCGACGAHADALPLTWSTSEGARGRQVLCERCTRENLRSIEGKLDEAWW